MPSESPNTHWKYFDPILIDPIKRAVRLIQSEPEPDDLHMLPLQYLDAFKTLLADKTFQAAMLSRGDYYRPMRD